MKNKTVALLACMLLLIIAASAAGCSAPDTGAEYVVFYANYNGVTDKNDWFALGKERWEDSSHNRGLYSFDKSAISFYDGKGENKLFSGTLDGEILSVERDGETYFYYSENFSQENIIGINTVYTLAKELGFEGTLQDLIEAFKGDSAYEVAKDNGYTGSETEWLTSLIGAQGEKGETPEIKNGYWYIGGVNTGVNASGIQGEKGDKGDGIISIEKVSSLNGQDTYKITYADNSTFNFTVTNGTDGRAVLKIEKTATAGNIDTYTIWMSDKTFYTYEVTNGKDAEYDLTVSELYDFMISNGYDGSYIDFVKLFAPSAKDVSDVTKGLLSSVSVVAGPSMMASVGSGIIYSIDKDKGDAIILTNYHVIYNDYASDGETEYYNEIKVYLYGSEVSANSQTAALEMGIPAEFIGGSKQYDIAVLKIRESELIKKSIARAAEFADSDYVYVGEDIIAVGNAEAEGISVTEGIVSMPSENIVALAIGSTSTFISRRVIRFDAAVSPGNSGGGLFDSDGKLVGIVCAKRTESKDEGIGYAIPSNVAVTIAGNILSQYAQNPSIKHKLYRPLVGMTVYVYSSEAKIDETTGGAVVIENICIDATTEGSVSDGKFLKGDFIKSIQVGNGKKKDVIHIYTLTDAVMGAGIGDDIVFEIERNGELISVKLHITEKEMAYAD